MKHFKLFYVQASYLIRATNLNLQMFIIRPLSNLKLMFFIFVPPVTNTTEKEKWIFVVRRDFAQILHDKTFTTLASKFAINEISFFAFLQHRKKNIFFHFLNFHFRRICWLTIFVQTMNKTNSDEIIAMTQVNVWLEGKTCWAFYGIKNSWKGIVFIGTKGFMKKAITCFLFRVRQTCCDLL